MNFGKSLRYKQAIKFTNYCKISPCNLQQIHQLTISIRALLTDTSVGKTRKIILIPFSVHIRSEIWKNMGFSGFVRCRQGSVMKLFSIPVAACSSPPALTVMYNDQSNLHYDAVYIFNPPPLLRRRWNFPLLREGNGVEKNHSSFRDFRTGKGPIIGEAERKLFLLLGRLKQNRTCLSKFFSSIHTIHGSPHIVVKYHFFVIMRPKFDSKNRQVKFVPFLFHSSILSEKTCRVSL